MPGILPMKMIRVGGNSQSRVAQACDRCRSKKIRCDGIRPCCTQCASVGFECKTSDKLSRRAFPRGYTESLEDRVRALEAEVRELKDLLDEKDEKLDMLSRLQSFSVQTRNASTAPTSTKADIQSGAEEFLHVSLSDSVNTHSSSAGSSTITSLIENFQIKANRLGKQTSTLPNPRSSQSVPPRSPASGVSKTPPRLLSDQYINVFFQEWQPLLPVVHRPSFLKVYEQYIANPDVSEWHSRKQSIAQLFLIFDIAAQSLMHGPKQHASLYEGQWRKALYSCSSTACLSTLQCHVLAQIYYLLRADYTHLARHRGIAIGMCHELGLHQGHAYLSLPTLESETRKRVFWCQYVLDKFTSTATGTPTLLRDADISTELPADVDDENVTSQGFTPALPGELTKISSGLALFRVSKILSKTLDNLYPSASAYKISLSKLHSLSDELDQWSEELPEHLRLRFCNDKPATYVTSDRSPLLSLAYFLTRNLIHRPLVCHGSGNPVSAATIVVAAAGKHILQILDLLVERRMNYAFPFSRKDLLLTAGFSVLWQSLELEPESKLVKDNQKSLVLANNMLMKENQGLASDFRKTVLTLVPDEVRQKSPIYQKPSPTPSALSATSHPNIAHIHKSPKQQLQAMASRLSMSGRKHSTEQSNQGAHTPRSNSIQIHRAGSTTSLPPNSSSPFCSSSSPSLDSPQTLPDNSINPASFNLEYPFYNQNISNHLSRHSTTTVVPPKQADFLQDFENWDNLLMNYDINYASNVYATSSPDLHTSLLTAGSTMQDWNAAEWPTSALHQTMKAPIARSHMSFSEESLTSVDDILFSATVSNNGSTSHKTSCDLSPAAASAIAASSMDIFHGIAIPVDDDFDYHE